MILSNLNIGPTMGSLACEAADSLPQNPKANTVYVVPNPDSTGPDDAFLCSIYQNGEWKNLGTTSLDFNSLQQQITELNNNKGNVSVTY